MEKGLISIDRWGNGSQAYFLTHLHADHTAGLSSRWSHGPLFCSPLSAKLLPSRFPGFDLSILRVLEVGDTVSISLRSPSTESEVEVLVTTIDAHHCPGAVMFLFRGKFGCVLHTGDFRWEPMSERARAGKKVLLDSLGGNKVDALYLDNTYCHPSFSFPTRDVAAQQVVDIISLHPDHDVIIGLDTLGKEELLLYISRALSTKIWVWPERLQTMHLLGFEDVFTTKTCLTSVRAVPRYSLTSEALEALNTVHPTIGIMPSGLSWGGRPFDKCHGAPLHYPHLVPYSEHSCFSEILEFIKIVQPSRVTGIVSSSSCHISPRHYLGRLSGLGHLRDKSLEKAEKCRIPKAKKGRNKVARLGVGRSRVYILRRERPGAKIADTDCSFDLAV